jgi:hypothetical protein
MDEDGAGDGMGSGTAVASDLRCVPASHVNFVSPRLTDLLASSQR